MTRASACARLHSAYAGLFAVVILLVVVTVVLPRRARTVQPPSPPSESPQLAAHRAVPVDDGTPATELTAVDHAAIELRVPQSGKPWLNDMICQARRLDAFERYVVSTDLVSLRWAPGLFRAVDAVLGSVRAAEEAPPAD